MASTSLVFAEKPSMPTCLSINDLQEVGQSLVDEFEGAEPMGISEFQENTDASLTDILRENVVLGRDGVFFSIKF